MLFVVATPIGNLDDITLRALTVLKTVDLIAAEDTRQTKKLLTRHHISTPLVSFHQHSRQPKTNQLISRLQAGDKIALVTDAGTPGISDPGGELVAAARQAGIQIVPIPGASAITAILSVAGVPADLWLFVGFLPKKKGRQTLWQELATTAMPIVIFESPHRVIKTLQEILTHLGDRTLVIGRELTKLHEEIVVEPTSQLIERFTATPPRGEFVIVIT
jgi:16S rRNA (cytidine1402-2'-O)-methyltransferase